jgi:hypothetical protein
MFVEFGILLILVRVSEVRKYEFGMASSDELPYQIFVKIDKLAQKW